MRHIRGNEISMIFQEPMTSLNPVFTVGNQIMEAIMLHQGVGKTEAREKAIEMLRLVGILAGAAGGRLSPPDERRYAPEGDDRHGPLLQPQAAHCR